MKNEYRKISIIIQNTKWPSFKNHLGVKLFTPWIEKYFNVGIEKSELLLWFQKHYVYPKFKYKDVFFNPFYFMGHSFYEYTLLSADLDSA